MKNLLFLVAVLFLVSSCKKTNDNDCEGPDCPLLDGSYCPPNMVNNNNQCVCPADYVLLNDSLCIESLEDDTTWTRFYLTFDCECVSGDLIAAFGDYIQFGGVYSLDAAYDPQQAGRFGGPFNFLPGATMSDFNALVYPAKCQGKDMYMHGSINGDTLNYELFFINSSSLDTCGPFQAIAF